MKKKVVSLLLVAAMVTSMGCGSSNNAGTTDANSSTGSDAAATTESGDASSDTAEASDVEKP